MSIVGTLPYTLTNGTAADANQVMADLNAIVTGVNTNAATNGNNSNITQLTGLTSPITVPQGGTGLYQFGLLEGARGLLITPGTTTFTVASGCAAATTGDCLAILTSTYTKSLGSWAVGSGAGVGSLDTGTVAVNTGYHVYGLIAPSSSSQATDIIISTNATAPTIPAGATALGYTKVSRLGWLLTNASAQIIAFVQTDNDFQWTVPIIENAGFNLVAAASRTLLTMSSPGGIKCMVEARLTANNVDTHAALVMTASPDEADTSGGDQTAPLFNFYALPGSYSATTVLERTNTNSQIAISALGSYVTANVGYWLLTKRFVYPRGQA